MFIEASEKLRCPACERPRGLVLFVDELGDERRVLTGELGCPHCGRRFPVAEGIVDLTGEAPPGDARTGDGAGDPESRSSAEGAAARESGPPPEDVAGAPGPDARPGEEGEETAVEVAALLGGAETRGYVLLAAGLAPVAPRVAELLSGAEVVAVVPPDAAAPGGGRLTRLRSPRSGRLPVLPGSVDGLVLWAPAPGRIREAVGCLAPGARLVGLRPSREAREVLAGLPVEILASEERAFVAARSESVEP